jgi:hypothetical protein
MKKYYILLAGAILAATIQTQAQTKIGGPGAPDSSAMLEVTSGAGNNKGILLPRISLANITTWGLNGSTPVAGMFVYNTNASVTGGSGVGTYYWDGTQWVKSTSAPTSGWNLAGNAGTSLFTNFLGTTDAQPLVLRTNSAEHMRITSAGNIGINNGAPTTRLSFAAVDEPKISLYDNGDTANIYGFGVTGGFLNYHVKSGGRHVFFAGGKNGNGTELMRIQSNGNVGIGTATPNQKLHVSGNSQVNMTVENTSGIVNFDLAGMNTKINTATAAPVITAMYSQSITSEPNGGLGVIRTSTPHDLVLGTNGVEHMRITNVGNVGINNSTPLSPLSFANVLGNKIALYNGGTNQYLGIGVSAAQLNYHVASNCAHVFYAGGTNGDGTELMRIVNDGNVGIGTSTPTAKLDINGTARIQGSAGTPTAITGRDAAGNINNITLGTNLSLAGGVLSATGGGTSGWGLNGNAGTNVVTDYIGTSDAQPLVLRTNAAEHLRITADGNVGINNGAPLVPLALASIVGPKISLYDNSSATEHYGFGVSGGQLSYQVMTGGSHVFLVGGKNNDGTELMRIRGLDGNVGIGTSAPTAKLDVNGTARIQGSAGTPTAITGRDASGNVGNITLGANLSLAGGVLSASGGGTSGWGLTGNAGTNPATNFIGTTDAQPLVFSANNDEKMRIMPNGNVGIGTAAPNSYVQIAKNDYGQFGGLAISDVAGANATNFTITPGYYGSVATFGVTLDVTGEAPIGFSDPIIPAADGSFSCGTSAYRWSAVYSLNGTINTSDSRMKKNVRDLDLGLDEIMKLRPVIYDWKNDTGKDKLGFIAQELRKVVPNVVVGDESKETLGVLYSDMIPVLTKAIQEQQGQIDALKAENQKLKTAEVELKENKVATAQLMERVKQMEQMMGIKEIEGSSKVAGK